MLRPRSSARSTAVREFEALSRSGAEDPGAGLRRLAGPELRGSPAGRRSPPPSGRRARPRRSAGARDEATSPPAYRSTSSGWEPIASTFTRRPPLRNRPSPEASAPARPAGRRRDVAPAARRDSRAGAPGPGGRSSAPRALAPAERHVAAGTRGSSSGPDRDASRRRGPISPPARRACAPRRRTGVTLRSPRLPASGRTALPPSERGRARLRRRPRDPGARTEVPRASPGAPWP